MISERLRLAAQAAEDFLDRRWRKTGACDDDIREHAEALRAALAEPQPAMARFLETVPEGDPPLERLRYFCSLAMSPQDWLDVESLFDACEQSEPEPEPVAWAGDPSTQDYTSTQPEPVAWMVTTRDPQPKPKITTFACIDYAPAPNDGITVLRKEPLYAAPQAQQPQPTFNRGDRVRKRSGSAWQGRVVGEYSTALTPGGYAVESDAHPGSVQIYPASALEDIDE